MSDFKRDSAERRFQMIQAERAALVADLASHEANGDYDSGAMTEQAIADLDRQHENLVNLYQRHVAAQQPRYDTASAESRAQRRPEEMTAQDMADVMNTSRYSGRGFSADDYYRLRSGLGLYRATRGTEQK